MRHRRGRALRRRYGHALKTQIEVEAAIKRFMARAVAAEVQRDRSAYESPTYWQYHDEAVKWHKKAEQLMPQRRR